MTFGPYNGAQALYYAASGQIRRISYLGALALAERQFLPLMQR
jgi:hypothetical protein